MEHDCLIEDTNDRPRPHNYHERTGHVLPEENNLLQFYIRDTEQFVKDNKMVINKNKTKVMSFRKSRKWDSPPELKFEDGTIIECIRPKMAQEYCLYLPKSKGQVMDVE